MTDPDLYRETSLTNCIQKLFSSNISTRTKHYLDFLNRICSELAGFRNGYGCQDHTFTLNKFLSLYWTKGQRVYATFPDYEKAFDLVDQAILWKKLQDHFINKKIFNVIRGLYSKTGTSVKVDNCFSSFFSNVRLLLGRVITYHDFCSLVL